MRNPNPDGHAIKIVRTVRRLTQQELAEASGVPVWRVWKFKNSQATPRPNELAAIWNALSSSQAE